MITFTEKGAEKVQEFLASQSADVQTSGLRVGVRGGGCSGFQYALAFDTQRDGDEVFEDHGLRILVDGPSLPVRQGRGRRLRRGPPGRRLQGRQPERHRGLRLRLLLPRRGRGRGLRRLGAVRPPGASAFCEGPPSRPARCALALSACGDKDEPEPPRAQATPTPTPTATPTEAAGAGADARAAVEVARDARQAPRRRHHGAEPELRLAQRADPAAVRALARRARPDAPGARTGSSSTGPRSSRAPTRRADLDALNGGCLRDKPPVRGLPRRARPAAGARRPPARGRAGRASS